MQIKSLTLAAAMAAGLACGSAHAAAITYEMTGSATYTLEGVDHSGLFDVVGLGDTAGVTHLPNPPFPSTTLTNGTVSGYTSAPFSIHITLDGVGAFDVLGAGNVFNAPSSNVAGFGSAANADFLYFLPGPGLLDSYDLASNFSLGGSGASPGQHVDTTGGALTFHTASDTTFSSRVDGVPEPAAWALMLVGFGGLGAALRARRKAVAATA